jgi:hypothetical protein
LRAAHRHHVEAKADALGSVLRAPALRQSPTLEGAYAAIVVGQVGIIRALNEQIRQLRRWWPSILADTRPLTSTSASRASG